MPSPRFPYQSESEAAFYAYRAAMARISNAAAFMALHHWRQRVAALHPDANPGYIQSLVPVVAGARRMARRLTQSWYQYSRALDSGYLAGESEADDDSSLESLRQNFLDRLQDAASLGHELSGDSETHDFERDLLDANYQEESERPNRRRDALRRELVDSEIQEWLERWGEDRDLDFEDFQWPRDSENEDIERHLDRVIREVAREQSRQRRDRLKQKEEQQEREATDEEIFEEHDKAGNQVAGRVHRVISDAADGTIRRALSQDRRVMRVARGTALRPCAFCALLASRGFVYHSIAAATFKPHDNCNCYPIPRWTTEEVELPAINNWFRELWEEVSRRGGTNEDKRREFRRVLNEEYGDNV